MKTAFVTGATRGIGLEICKKLVVLGVSDKKFTSQEKDLFYGYKCISVEQMLEMNFDYIIFMLKNSFYVVKDLQEKGLNTNIMIDLNNKEI